MLLHSTQVHWEPMEVQPEPPNVSGQLSLGVIADVFVIRFEVMVPTFLHFNDLDPADHSPGTRRAQGPPDPRHGPGRSQMTPHQSTGTEPVQLFFPLRRAADWHRRPQGQSKCRIARYVRTPRSLDPAGGKRIELVVCNWFDADAGHS